MSDSDLFSSDEDVIPSTPQKPKNNTKFCGRKKEQLVKSHQRMTTFSAVKSLHKIPFVLNLKTELPNASCVASSVTISENLHWKKPYVFFEIRQILNFSGKNFPSNNKIRTLGTFKQENSKQFTLNFNNTKLNLNLSSLNRNFPKVDDVIEIFGCADFQRMPVVLLDVPVFIVQFWRKREGNIQQYINTIKLLKTYIPDECKQMINDEVEISKHECTVNFEELDESLICRVVDNIENINI